MKAFFDERNNLTECRSAFYLACVARGIVSAREIKASGEATRRRRGTLKYCLQENHRLLNSPHTSVREKRIGQEK